MYAHDPGTAADRPVRAPATRSVQPVEWLTGPLSAAGLVALQRSAGNRAVSAVVQRDEDETRAGDQVRSVLGSRGGTPLDTTFRAKAESFLGADLSQVRVHTGAAAAGSARSVQAHAYTSGSDIVFGSGMYDTTSAAGQSRLAHELTHVVQQQRGPVAGTVSAGGLAISDPSDRFERQAERMGAAFVATRSGDRTATAEDDA